MDSLKNIVDKKGIKYLFHFTPVENLDSIIKNGLYLRSDAVNAVCLDTVRADNTDGVCLSVSFPNSKMFYSRRKENKSLKWVVIALKPSVIWELNCRFFPTNAAFERCRGIHATGTEAFTALFADTVNTKNGTVVRLSVLLEKDPTDVQAEIIVLQNIPINYILGYVFDSDELMKEYKNMYPSLKFFSLEKKWGYFDDRNAARSEGFKS